MIRYASSSAQILLLSLSSFAFANSGATTEEVQTSKDLSSLIGPNTNLSDFLASFKVEPLPNSNKAKVVWVKKGSLAEKSGLKVGDIVTGDNPASSKPDNAIKLHHSLKSKTSD